MRNYEVVVILDPSLDERTVQPSLDKYLNVVRNDGGTVENVDIWGKRRLAYEIKKNAEGIYAIIKLTAALATVFPQITPDYPRDAAGNLVTVKLPDDQLAAYHGVLGHFHIQTNKTDPGPALQWDKVIDGARRLLRLPRIKRPAAN